MTKIPTLEGQHAISDCNSCDFTLRMGGSMPATPSGDKNQAAPTVTCHGDSALSQCFCCHWDSTEVLRMLDFFGILSLHAVCCCLYMCPLSTRFFYFDSKTLRLQSKRKQMIRATLCLLAACEKAPRRQTRAATNECVRPLISEHMWRTKLLVTSPSLDKLIV